MAAAVCASLLRAQRAMPLILMLLSAIAFCVEGRSVSAVAAAVEKFDVVVYGATPAGVQAAVAVGRRGLRCALVEPSLYVGGCMSGGLSVTDVGVHPYVMGGSAFEVFERIARHYKLPGPLKPLPKGACDPRPGEVPWRFEPHVAENVFADMLREANVTVKLGRRVVGVEFDDTQIARLDLADVPAEGSPARFLPRDPGAAPDASLSAAQFVDATYEGSLLKASNGQVSYTFGREPRSKYNETVAGVLPEPSAQGPPYGHTDQFKQAVSPYTDATNTTCVPHVVCNDGGVVGSGDSKLGAYDWRVCFTSDPANMLPIPEPEHYDPAEFEMLRRILAAINATEGKAYTWNVPRDGIPNNKTDWKVTGPPGFSGEYVGGSWEYPNATWERQQQIVSEHKRFTLALFKFWRTDPAVSLASKAALAPGRVGLPRDEFNRSLDHWMPQLYVREGLRLVGEYIMTEADVLHNYTKSDVVGLGSYSIDIPGAVQRIVKDGHALLEGSMQSPDLCPRTLPAFAIPFRSLLPKRSECTNLIVPVGLSASHVAYNAIRMEPQWMVLGQSSGVAAAMAAEMETSIQDVDVGRLQATLRQLGQVLDPANEE